MHSLYFILRVHFILQFYFFRFGYTFTFVTFNLDHEVDSFQISRLRFFFSMSNNSENFSQSKYLERKKKKIHLEVNVIYRKCSFL